MPAYYFAHISCSNPPASRAENIADKKLPSVSIPAKQAFALPVVTEISQHKQPKKIIAGKPFIKPGSTGTGIPFFTNYNTDQGLPVNNIICSMADKAGNLWFGTGGGGVSRFDGKNFTNYSTAQGLAGNVVFGIAEDNAGNLWIGTTSGASRYNGRRFFTYSTAQGLAGNFVTSVLQDKAGNIWFGTHNGGASKYDGKNFTNYAKADGLANNYVRCMIQDKMGNLWLGTDAGGISMYDGRGFTNYTTAEGLGNNAVNCIKQDNAGNLWFGTNSGVSRFDGTSFKNYTAADGLADNNVFCIAQDETGDLWFGTHTKGVSKFDGSQFRNYNKADGLADNKVNSIIQDKAGNVWISSQGGGVSKYEGNSFTGYTTEQGLAANLVFSIIQDKHDNLWFGTYEGGVSKYDGHQFANYSKAQGLPDVSIWSMLADKAGNIWFGTDRAGAVKFDGKYFTDYTTEQGLVGNAVISMMQDKAGNIWFGTRESGASKFDGHRFTSFTVAQGLAGNNIQSMAEDKAGNIWFGTHKGGVSKYDGRRFTNFTTDQGLAGNDVSAVLEDQNGNLWFGTDGKGISKYNGKNFINYSTAQGLPDNAVSFISEDQTRNIVWFGTNSGLSAFKENQPYGNYLYKNVFENFGKVAGYPVRDISTGGMLADNKGYLWAGSGEGKLIRFNYGALNKKHRTQLNLVIKSVQLNNEQICWNSLPGSKDAGNTDSLTLLNEMVVSFGKELTPAVLDNMRKKYSDIQLDSVTKFYPLPVNLILPHNDNTISFDFAAVEPAMQKQVQYQYRLQGYSHDWSPLSNNTSAVFGNMPQGSYVFQLKALSPFGVWSEAAYPFRVLSPWWLSWWAYTLYALTVIAVLYAVYKTALIKTERRQAAEINIIVATQEEERKRISRDLHDDIGARLTNMNILAALGLQKIDKPQEMPDHLAKISNEVQASAEALDDIVWSIDTQNDSMEQVTARMRRYAADVFDQTNTSYTIDANEKALPSMLATGMRRDLFFVFKESINNIQKHAQATAVKITVEAKDGILLMEVSDNGKGFGRDVPTHRNGLKNMQQRIRKWGGSLTVQSAVGKGTRVKNIFTGFGRITQKGDTELV